MIDENGQPGEGQGEGKGQGEGEGEGQGEGQGPPQGSPSGQPGDGMGEGSEGALGEESGMDTQKKNLRVNADQGRGQTRAQIIEQASQEGFAGAGYRRVFQDYENFAQSALDSEDLPPSQRRRVKRYYQMIQPRD